MEEKTSISEYIFRIFTLFLFLFCFSGTAADKIIKKVEFMQSGRFKYPQQILFFNVQSKEGTLFDEKILDKDVKRLYSTGLFSDVATETRELDNNGIKIVFKLTAKPRIKKIEFLGNKKFNDDELKKEIVIYPNTPANEKKIKTSLDNLRKFYRSKGYNDAVITCRETATDDPNFIILKFFIDENLRLKVNSVTFKGNTVFSSWTLRDTVATQHSWFSWLFNTGLFDKEELENDKIRLRYLYWDKGYLDFKVKKIDVKPLKDDPEYVDVIFFLKEGKPYKVGQLYISGNYKFPEAELRKLITVKPGDIYNHSAVNASAGKIEQKYYPSGYADIICKPIRVPDFLQHTVDINFKITEGKSYKIRNIYISGNRITKDYVIRRELKIHPGDALDVNMVKLSKERIMGLGYFENVKVLDKATELSGQRDVKFQVKEKPTGHIKIGAGVSDTEPVAGMLELSQSNFDITNPDNYFRGGGQRLSLRSYIGLRTIDFRINFTEPWLFGIPLKLNLSGYHETDFYRYWREQHIGGDLSLTHKIFDDYTALTLGYKFGTVRVFHMDNDRNTKYFRHESGTDLVSTLSLNLNRNTLDNPSDPTQGYELNALGAITTRLLGASNNYYRIEGKGVYYISFLEKAIRFHVGAKFGLVDRFGSNRRVPIYERYFLGGGDSLRGFPYRTVSPEDNEDKPYGGESMFLVTAEVSHPIWRFVRGAIFVDAGTAWDRAWSYNTGDINVGAGYGLRIRIPQLHRPIRLDLAYPIVNNLNGVKSRFRFHFNIGFEW